MKKNRVSFLLLLLSAGILAGCGSASVMKEASAPMEAAVFEETENSAAGGSPGIQEAGADITEASAAPAAEGRKLIRTVHAETETDAFDDTVSAISRKISDLGGYIQSSDLSGSRNPEEAEYNPRYLNLTVRIPAGRMDEFLTAVDGCSNVIFRSENTEDITLQYTDTESRKKSLEIEQARLNELLAEADSVETVLLVEERLSEVRYQLESMNSQLRLYDNQVDLGTVHLSVREVQVFTPTAPLSPGARIQKGFTENLHRMGEFLVDTFVFLLSSVPIWLPVLLIVLLVVFRKRGRKRVLDAARQASEESDSSDVNP